MFKYLNVSDRERPAVIWVGLLYFSLMLGWGVGSAGRNALFVKEIGPDKLPYLYIFNAILLVAISNIYSRFVDRICRYRLLIGLLILSAVSLLGLRLVIPLNFYLLPYVIFFLSELILQVLIVMHFWTVANEKFNPREGKRVFPLIGGAGLTGAIVGGLLTAVAAKIIGTANLFSLWSLLLFASIPIVYRIKFLAGPASSDSSVSSIDPGLNQSNNDGGRLREMLQIPLIRSLTYIALPMWIVVNIVDYQFLHTMNETIQDQDRLAGILGLLNSIFSACGLLLQLFITSRLLNRYGVGAMILAHAVSMTVGSLGLLLRSIVAPAVSQALLSFRSIAAIFASFSDEVIAISTGESASQLLFNAIPESKRGRCRAFIYGTVEPICAMLSGILLIVLIKSEATELFLSSVLVACSIIWIWFSVKVESTYLEALVDNLGSGSVELQVSAMIPLANAGDRSSIPILLEGLTSKDDRVALHAFEILNHRDLKNLTLTLCRIIPRVNNSVKVAILETIRCRWSKSAISVVRPMVDYENHKVSAAAIKTIGQVGEFDDVKALERFVDSTDLDVRSEAIIALMRWNIDNEKKILDAQRVLQNLVQCPQSFLRTKAAYIIGEVASKDLVPVLIELSNSDDELVIHEVIIACGKIQDARVIPVLLGFLKTERYTYPVINAVCRLGGIAAGALHQLLLSDDTNEKTQSHILICLGKLGDVASLAVIINYLDKANPPLPCEATAITALNAIKQENLRRAQNNDARLLLAELSAEAANVLSQNVKRLSNRVRNYYEFIDCLKVISNQESVILLIDALTRYTKESEEVALKCLEFIADPISAKAVALSLRSSSHRTRSEALETLDASSAVAKDLVTVLEPIYLHAARAEDHAIATEVLFARLFEEDFPQWLQACTVYSIGELRLKHLGNTILNRYRSTRDRLTNPLIKNQVLLAMTKIDPGKIRGFDADEINALNSRMKQIQFLRSVLLFSEMEGSDLYWISTILNVEDFTKGEILFREGEKDEIVGVIESGRIRETGGNTDNKTLAVIGSGECYGELSIFDNEPTWLTTGEALEPTRVFIITHSDFHDLLVARPKLGISLMKITVLRLQSAMYQLRNRAIIR